MPPRKWETVGSSRRKGDGLEAAVDGNRYIIAAADAPGLIVEGNECDIWQSGCPPFKVGRASWSDSGRMLVLSLPGKCGLVMVAGARVVSHYLKEDTTPIDVVRPPAPSPERHEPTPLPPGVRLGVV
ncbi:MAG TPA: hypothetical protein HA263_07920 [Methanoregulaceae archaeon]|nr:hypothetical protein [Methanoregulaceae archaeon]